MVDVVVFNIVIPCTENATGIVHAPSKFSSWVLKAAERFGGISVVGLGLQGLWFDPALPNGSDPVEDHNNWYKIGVEPGRVAELREFVGETARAFGQKCIYMERAGEAEFVWDPQHRPPETRG